MVLEYAIVTLALAFGAAGMIAALRMRTIGRIARVGTRLSRERDVATLEATRRFGLAARRSLGEVRAEIVRAIHVVAPTVDVVLIFDEADDALACVHADGARAAYFLDTRIARSDDAALPIRAMRRGHRALLDEPGVRAFHPSDVAALAVPLPGLDGKATVVYIAARSALDEPTIEALVMLIDLAGSAYALADERERDRVRAEFDGLTGLVTPRVLRERLAVAIERARFDAHARLALVFIDTDHFKAWNDTYGHASGDALLRALADTLRAALREGDVAARNGGDEFCLIFHDCEKSAAIERADALRAAIDALDVGMLRPSDATQIVTVSASIGVAAYPVDAATPAALLERADEAMYHSKRTGRNAVSYATLDGALARLERIVSTAS